MEFERILEKKLQNEPNQNRISNLVQYKQHLFIHLQGVKLQVETRNVAPAEHQTKIGPGAYSGQRILNQKLGLILKINCVENHKTSFPRICRNLVTIQSDSQDLQFVRLIKLKCVFSSTHRVLSIHTVVDDLRINPKIRFQFQPC